MSHPRFLFIPGFESTTVHTHPMTRQELLAATDEDGYVEGVIAMPFHRILAANANDPSEGGQLLDLLIEALTGSADVIDIQYQIVGLDTEQSDTVLIQVTGDVSRLLEEAP